MIGPLLEDFRDSRAKGVWAVAPLQDSFGTEIPMDRASLWRATFKSSCDSPLNSLVVKSAMRFLLKPGVGRRAFFQGFFRAEGSPLRMKLCKNRARYRDERESNDFSRLNLERCPVGIRYEMFSSEVCIFLTFLGIVFHKNKCPAAGRAFSVVGSVRKDALKTMMREPRRVVFDQRPAAMYECHIAAAGFFPLTN